MSNPKKAILTRPRSRSLSTTEIVDIFVEVTVKREKLMMQKVVGFLSGTDYESLPSFRGIHSFPRGVFH